MSRELSVAQAINEGLHQAMREDDNVIVYGLGVTDPGAIFGTTVGLQQQFGGERVFDMPTAENAMTGMAIGAALNGIRPVMVHQRLDFFILAMDQLVNGAAKWRYMFGANNSVPITIRLIIGRGWGQGPTHSQNLQAWFTHIPGLKVVMPTSAKDAKGLLLASIFDNNPVVFLEHRWLHHAVGSVPKHAYRTQLGKAQVVRQGEQATIVAMSYLTVEAMRAADWLESQDVSCEVIDLRTIKPLDWDTIFDSVSKTGRLLALDTGCTTGSVAGEIVARVSIERFSQLKAAPARLAMPDIPEPSSPALTKGFYINAGDIASKVLQLVGLSMKAIDCSLQEQVPHDVPGEWFKGPF